LLVRKATPIIPRSTPARMKPDWFIFPKPNPLAKFRLFCFHDAGGNASLYHNWQHQLGDHFELVAVELPGRRNRSSEKPYSDLSTLIRDLLPAVIPMLDKPFYFFGHSMGGLIAFELVRSLRKTNNNLPAKIFISSTPGLASYSRREVDHTLSEEEMIDIFPHLKKKNIGDDSLRNLLMNLLRADLRLLNNYRYVNEEPLPVPMVIIHGINDARVRKDQAEQWQKETTSSFTVIARPGGHRYIEDDNEFLTSLIAENIRLAENEPVYERVY
jgi:surfactin synthase thioesterase subunit